MIEVKNYMENCVCDLIPKVLDGQDICKCEQCTMDIKAHALNHLPPKYVATDRGNIFAKVDAMHTQFDTDIIAAISNAARIIGANPRHG